MSGRLPHIFGAPYIDYPLQTLLVRILNLRGGIANGVNQKVKIPAALNVKGVCHYLYLCKYVLLGMKTTFSYGAVVGCV